MEALDKPSDGFRRLDDYGSTPYQSQGTFLLARKLRSAHTLSSDYDDSETHPRGVRRGAAGWKEAGKKAAD